MENTTLSKTEETSTPPQTEENSTLPQTEDTSTPPETEESTPLSPMEELRKLLKTVDDLQVLRHFLGHPLPGAPPLLDNAVLIGLDLEWYEYPRYDEKAPITEVGLAIITGKNLVQFGSTQNADFMRLLSHVKVHHYRIQEDCHLRNIGDDRVKMAKAEHNFLFGQTRFLLREEAKERLIGFLEAKGIVGVDNPSEAPVILVGHGKDGLEDDDKHLDKQWGVNLLDRNVVKIITTGKMAFQAGVRPQENGTFHEMTKGFELARIGNDSDSCKLWLHNAGNDAAYETLVALLIGKFPHLYPTTNSGYPSPTDVQNTPMARVVTDFITSCQAQPTPDWGSPHFCFRCGSDKHDFSSGCKHAIKICEYCSAIPGPENANLRKKAKDHPSDRCVVKRNPTKIKTVKFPDTLQQFFAKQQISKNVQRDFMIAINHKQEVEAGRIMIEAFKTYAPFKVPANEKFDDDEEDTDLGTGMGKLAVTKDENKDD